VNRIRRSNPLWYKDAIIYELHVRAFHDSNGDGIGDFRGPDQKLDYLQDLGVTAIWLLPFYPSPLKDDGYDIADYTARQPRYGTLSDFRSSSRGAPPRPAGDHRAGDQPHLRPAPWFQRPAAAPSRAAPARLLRLERHARQVQGRADHLQGLRDLQLDLGPGGQGLLLAPLLLTTSPT
jgi:maltose alpha-D-glucosyltransferase / alpha-amylase